MKRCLLCICFLGVGLFFIRPAFSPVTLAVEPSLSSSESRVFTNALGMKFLLLPAGAFMMGSPATEIGRDDEEIRHQVTITKLFYIQTTEVTV
ncbi:MAG: hypothetical protein HQK55_15720, partial [Deltaproteobacteria bacterium]|nr:hypothetical protein [Deltaproteobacteria bacterium]